MSKVPQKKKAFPWRRYLLLAIVAIIIARTVWRVPRTTWSLQGSPPTAQVRESVRQAIANAKDLRGVVLISIDTLRADHLGCYGYSRDTSSNIDALANQSIVFNHAVAPVPITLPAHSSMHTGTTPLHHKVHDNINYRLSESSLTLAEILKKNGFATGAIIGAFALDSQFGLDQGFDTYDDDFKDAREGFFESGNQRDAAEVTKLANRWLGKHGNDKFFLFLHYYDPHTPYELHSGFRFKTALGKPSARDAYDSEIAYTDYHVGKVIETLKEMGLYDSTLIILTSDHGESFGEHGENGHSFFIYHSTLHVPLIIKIPQSRIPVKIYDVVGLVDIVPTVCGLLGIEPDLEVQGRDLRACFSQEPRSEPERALFCESLKATIYGAQSLLGVVTSRYKYIQTTRSELYDLFDDLGETDNIIEDEPEIARKLQEQLMHMLGENVGPGTDSKVELGQEDLSRLRSPGYVGGPVEEDFDLTESKDDPKDLIALHALRQVVIEGTMGQEFGKAKAAAQEMIRQRPEFYDPVMSALAYVLATHPDAEVRDPKAALAMAKHGVQLTEYGDWESLFALAAAYDAVGLVSESKKALDRANELAPAGTNLPTGR